MKRNILELKRRLYDESDYEFYRYVSSLKGEQLLLFDKLMEELLDTRLDAAAGHELEYLMLYHLHMRKLD